MSGSANLFTYIYANRMLTRLSFAEIMDKTGERADTYAPHCIQMRMWMLMCACVCGCVRCSHISIENFKGAAAREQGRGRLGAKGGWVGVCSPP